MNARLAPSELSEGSQVEITPTSTSPECSASSRCERERSAACTTATRANADCLHDAGGGNASGVHGVMQAGNATLTLVRGARHAAWARGVAK